MWLIHFIISMETKISISYFECRKLREIKSSENILVSIQLRFKKKAHLIILKGKRKGRHGVKTQNYEKGWSLYRGCCSSGNYLSKDILK